MPLNLLTLTRTDGVKVDINPVSIVMVETIENVTRISLANGDEVQVNDTQADVRKKANNRAPDGS